MTHKNEKTDALQLQESQYRTMLLAELTSHIGQMHAIGMAELYETVYGEAWQNRINDTRKLRTLITDLRREGVSICSVSSSSGGGYSLPAAGSELKGYLRNSKIRALRILARVSKIQKISLPELLGQMRLEMEAGHDETA
jgi:hypothetical protein